MNDQHTSGHEYAVVVGVDGTATALHAVAWAADEAVAHGGSLRIVHAAPYAVDAPGTRRATGILARAKAVARHERPRLAVHTRCVGKQVLDGLLGEAEGAQLLVTGLISETIADTVLGSVTLDVLGRSSCPVAVVRRSDAIRGRGILVGVADPRADTSALLLAFTEAAAHDDGVTVIHVDGRRPGFPTTDLVDAVGRLSARFPHVRAHVDSVHGDAADVLARRSAAARMVIVGGGGPHDARRVLLGSTSRALVWNSACPVLVAPRDAQRHATVGAAGPEHDAG